MNNLKKVQFVLFASIISILISACSYKPATHYAKDEINGNVYVKVNIDLADPQNSVLIKDSVKKMLIQKLDVDLVDKESLADTIMIVDVNGVSMQSLQYDVLGYNKLYRAVVSITFTYYEKDETKKKSFVVSGEHDFSIDNGTTINSNQRYDAIRKASDKALEEVLSKIAVASYKK